MSWLKPDDVGNVMTHAESNSVANEALKPAHGDTISIGNKTILARMQKMSWREQDGYFVTQIRGEGGDVERMQRFFSDMRIELRNRGIRFADVETEDSRIHVVKSEPSFGSVRFEIRLSADDMKALGISMKQSSAAR